MPPQGYHSPKQGGGAITVLGASNAILNSLFVGGRAGQGPGRLHSHLRHCNKGRGREDVHDEEVATEGAGEGGGGGCWRRRVQVSNSTEVRTAAGTGGGGVLRRRELLSRTAGI